MHNYIAYWFLSFRTEPFFFQKPIHQLVRVNTNPKKTTASDKTIRIIDIYFILVLAKNIKFLLLR